MRPSGRPPSSFSVAVAAARTPPGVLHRKAAAAARSRAALALVLLVSAAAFFFVVAARGSGNGGIGVDVGATPSSSSSAASSSSGPSVRPSSAGTRSVSASGAEEEKKRDIGAEEAATEEADDGAKRSGAPPPPPLPLTPPPPVSVFFARPVRELRHDGSAFTQGLEFDRICSGPHALPSPDSASGGGGGCRDVLWESTGEDFSLFPLLFPAPLLLASHASSPPLSSLSPTPPKTFHPSPGLNGRSTVRLVDLESGKVLRTAKLPDDAFGEGLTKVEEPDGNDASPSSSPSRLLQLTWLSGRAFWHDADALLNSTDGEIGTKDSAEALGGATDGRRSGGRAGGAGGSKKSGSPLGPNGAASEETRTPLGDGWGAAFVPAASAVALSDGSSKITFADARNVSRALRTITVTDEEVGGEGGQGSERKKRVEVFNLNELEWVSANAVRSLLLLSSSGSSSSSSSSSSASNGTAAAAKALPLPLFGLGGGKKPKGGAGAGNASLSDGELWANVWGTPCVARVDPLTGAVVGWVLAPDLRPRALAAAASSSAPLSAASSSGPQGQVDVLNGIAVDDGTRREAAASGAPPLVRRARLFLTGKNWPLLFEVRLEESGGGKGCKEKSGSSSSSNEPSSSSSSSSTSSCSSQQQAALTAARGSCIRPPTDFG